MCSLIAPYLMKRVIDALISVNNLTTAAGPRILLMLIFWWFMVSLILVVINGVRNFVFWTMVNKVYYQFSADAFKKILRKDITVFNKNKSGELLHVFDDGGESIWGVCHHVFNELFPQLVSFIFITVFALTVNWKLTLVLLAVIPIQIALSWYHYVATKHFSEKTRALWDKAFGIAGDVFQNIHATKAYAREQYESARLDNWFLRAVSIQLRANVRWMWARMFDTYIIGEFAVLIAGALLVFNGEITVGTLVMFTSFVGTILLPINMFAMGLQNNQKDATKFKKLEALLAEPETIVKTSGTHTQKKVQGAITARHVSFGYGKKQVLSNISFNIKPGERIALVGPSGAGKSTLALLIARFYDPQKGTILLDGVDMRAWNYQNLREHIAVVWQENMLFHESLEFNVKYGDLHATKNEIMAAAERANIKDFILGQKKKLKTVVGERGIYLSGGEKQRVMVARAILRNADVIVLDEATSALDSITERHVQEGIRNLTQDKTSIIIAHRLSTIKHVDRIFVVKNGKIIAAGPHEELMNTCPLYHRMVDLQIHGVLQEEEIKNPNQ